MEEVEGPSAVLMAAGYYDFDGFTDAAVGFDSGIAQVIEAAQDVVVPKRREREAQPALVDDLASAKRAEHAALEQIVFGALADFRDRRRFAPGSLVFEESFEDADGGVERRAPAGGRFGDTKGAASQFQPPSSSCSPRSCLANVSLGFLKYEPMPRILPLMQGSVSP